MDQLPTDYPATLEIDYPDNDRDWFITLLRPLLVVPIAIVLALVSGPAVHAKAETWSGAAGGILFFATVLMLVFRQKYPGWWFDWNVALLRFINRVGAYLLLLRDDYPSTDDEQNVHLEVDYPDVPTQLNRWLPLVKGLMAIPHFIVLIFLSIAAIVVALIAWFAILFTGRYPQWAFDFEVGVMRWHNRVAGYALVLVTDQYPPFSLD